MHVALYNSPKLKTRQTPFSGLMVKPTVIYPYHGTLLDNKQKQYLYTEHLGVLSKKYAKRKKLYSKSIYCMIAFI